MNYLKITSLKPFKTLALVSFILLFNTCDNLFEYSVYQADIKQEYENATAKNLQLLKTIETESDNFKFAFISDSHYFYNGLGAVIEDINKREDISFVIFGGDLAEQGLLKEYELFYNMMKKLSKPYLTVIGNHDYSSNGGAIYSQMFGEYNYSFEFNKTKFVMFDDIVWESNKEPNFDWLSTELNNNTTFKQVFVVAHIPPFGDQLDDKMEQRYSAIMQENTIPLSIHGHTHSYLYEKVYSDSVNYLTVPALKDPEYCIISVLNETFNVELIKL